MKKILFSCLIALSLLAIPNLGFAKSLITVKTSENLSQLWIPCKADKKPESEANTTTPESSKQTTYYECQVEPGMGAIQIMLGTTIQYATFLIGLVGVLFIVINGMMYSIGGDDKSGAKDRIMKSVFGLILLLLSWVLLNAIAPWIYGGS